MDALSIPGIATAVYAIIEILKQITDNNPKFCRFIPLIACVTGMLIGVFLFFAIPELIPAETPWMALIIGAASGLTTTGVNQVVKQLKKPKQ